MDVVKSPLPARISSPVVERAKAYPLMQALLRRRSRRFAQGLRLSGGPLSFTSSHEPHPLNLEEEAVLAFAACGITGYGLAELPYQNGDAPETGGGNILIHFIGRTVASGDAVHAVALFVINDGGAWFLKRPQDYPRHEIPALVQAAKAHEFAVLYEKSRVRIANRRLDVPRTLPHVPPFNQWSANQPGTSYFLPVNELTALYINIMLAAFSGDFGYFILDERRGFQPAGIGRFARSRGGTLHDDPAEGRVATIACLETWLCEFTAFEQGQMLQNLALAAEALGLGGFPHFAAHPFGWTQALGFRMEDVALARTIGAGPLKTGLLNVLRRNVAVPTAVGLERVGEVLLKPFCPPYYPSMKEAVLAFVEYKYGVDVGTLRDGGSATAWRDGSHVQAGIPRYSDEAIDATIAYCDYVYRRYGRFPANSGPFRTLLAYQAHHLDQDFYERFYDPARV
ncbi:MAG TPA: hypothetical protein VHF07_02045 [Nitrospiraceae bacterium]|nr:hypothetical protein [Nitrospiraceae bacterium]